MRRALLAVASLGVALWLPGGCGGDGGTEAVVVAGDGAEVEIPAGAIASIEGLGVALATGRVNPSGAYEWAGQEFAFTPHGTSFLAPVTVRLPYDESVGFAELAVFRRDDEADTTWELVPGATFAGGVATVQTQGFSILGVAGLLAAIDLDFDGDGVKTSQDCNDHVPEIHPGAVEVCGIGTYTYFLQPWEWAFADTDCSGEPNDKDADGDGHVDADCAPWHPGADDCDDDVATVHGGAAEACNGVDDDCDGQTDEALIGELGPVQDGVCAGARMQCAGAAGWVDPTYADYSPDYQEVEAACDDGKDNDCDGAADTADADCGTCVPTDPPDEVCDGADNDCNGQTDDGLTAPLADVQDGVCAGAVKVCLGAGGWQEPDYPSLPGFSPYDVDCDGVDENCDGAADEAYIAKQTTCGEGACAAQGMRTCVDGGEVDDCTPGTPGDELCDGTDGDCDGKVDCADEDCADEPACTGCTPTVPPDEVCDGVDNDCDGGTDDGLTAPPADVQDGVCAGAVKVCLGGDGWQEPDYPSLPGFSPYDVDCDGVDENCDGVADEAYIAKQTTCGEGACAALGTRTCVGGSVVDDCTPGTPGAELCDGTDGDCDGKVDCADEDCLGSPACPTEDLDGDGFTVAEGDCADDDPDVHPGHYEMCGDAADNDCNPATGKEACVTCGKTVPDAGAGLATLQDGLDAFGVFGGVLCVEAGSYAGPVDFKGFPVRVVGVAGLSRTVLQGTTVKIDQDPAADPPPYVPTLEGFTLDGSAVTVSNASPVLRNLRFTGADGFASLEIGQTTGEAAVTLTNAAFVGNTAPYGVVRILGWIATQPAVSFQNVGFFDNESGGGTQAALVVGGSGSFGGAFTWHNGIVAGTTGIGAYLAAGTLTLRNVTVVDNHSADGPGGVWFPQGTADCDLANVVVAYNSTTTGGQVAGGIYSVPAAASYRGVFVYGNEPYDYYQRALLDWIVPHADPMHIPDGTTAEGNAVAAPYLVEAPGPDLPSWGADLRLQTTSLLVDRGWTFDADADPDGSATDPGAFGGPGAAAWDLDGDGFPAWWRPGPYDPDAADGPWDCDDFDPTVSPAAEGTCPAGEPDPCSACGAGQLCQGGACVDLDCWPATCSACEVFVPSDQAPSIQAGLFAASLLDAAPDWNMVCVLPGDYAEEIDWFGLEVDLVGLGGASQTRLTGRDQVGLPGTPFGPIVRFVSGEDGRLFRGFTLHGAVNAWGNNQGEGGAIYLQGASPTLKELVIRDNTAPQGAGLYAGASAPTLEDVWFHHNVGAYQGGMLLEYGTDPVVMTRVAFTANEGNKGALDIHDQAGPVTVTHGLFAGNRGTGVNSVGGISHQDAAELTLDHVTMVGNTGTTGAIWGGGTVTSTVVAYNEGTTIGGLTVTATVTYSDFFGNPNANVHPWMDLSVGPGNVQVPPVFRSLAGADPTRWDLRLGATSPLLGAGAGGTAMGAYGGAEGAPALWDADGDGVALDEDCNDFDAAVAVAGSCDCTPECAGKTCGPDGCGGVCGMCPPASTCTAAGLCDSGSPDDADGDGFAAKPGGADCDDADPTAFPGHRALCDGLGVDHDCDGLPDQGPFCVTCNAVVPDDHATLRDAVLAWPTGAVICVRPGIYEENVAFFGHGVSLVGLGGPAHTVLKGDGAGRVVRISAGEGPSAGLDGFSVTGGVAVAGSDAGGVLVADASPTLSRLHIHGNEAATGAGMHVTGFSEPVLDNVLFEGNIAGYYGGGLTLDTVPADLGQGPVRPDVVLTRVAFVDNAAAYTGGGLLSGSTAGGDSANLAVYGAVFAGNTAAAGGGYYGYTSGEIVFQNATFVGNGAADTAEGGGMRLWTAGGGVALWSVVFADNQATDGSAVFGVGGSVVDVDGAVFLATDGPALNASLMALAVDAGTTWLLPPTQDPAVALTLVPGTWHPALGQSWLAAGAASLPDFSTGPSTPGAYGGPTSGTWDLDGDGFVDWAGPGPYPGLHPGGAEDCDDLDAFVLPGAGGCPP